MFIKVFQVGSFQSNSILISDSETKDALIIDPGDEADLLIREIEAQELKPKHIFLTHAHIDHIAAVGKVQKHFQADLCLHKEDLSLYENLKMQADMFGLTIDEASPPISHQVEQGEIISVSSNLQAKVLYTPGHSPGSVCYYFENFSLNTNSNEQKTIPLLICGDTLFAGSIGRTDLWGGNYESLIKSVKEEIFTLPPNTLVIPGHGPNTTVENEMKNNPFFSGS